MLDLKKEYATDKEKEIEGIWMEDFGEGVRIKIARIGNPEYQKKITKFQKPHRKAMRRGTLPDSVADTILNRAVADTIVLDWEGIAEDGKLVPYSFENCLRILNEYKDFRDQVIEAASEMETFKLEQDDESEGNSPPTSSGTQELAIA